MWNKPVVNLRTNVIRRGAVPKFVQLYRDIAGPSVSTHLGQPLGFYLTEIGALNRVFEFWAHDGLGDLEARRQALQADSQWGEFMAASETVILSQTSTVLRRHAFPSLRDVFSTVHDKPVIDFRTYSITRNRMNDFLENSERYAMPVQLKHIGPPLAYYVTEIGELNQVTHLWGYDSVGDMEARRISRNADPEWRQYLDASDGLFVNQQTLVVRRMPIEFG